MQRCPARRERHDQFRTRRHGPCARRAWRETRRRTTQNARRTGPKVVPPGTSARTTKWGRVQKHQGREARGARRHHESGPSQSDRPRLRRGQRANRGHGVNRSPNGVGHNGKRADEEQHRDEAHDGRSRRQRQERDERYVVGIVRQ
eukprot:7376719-Prymnesium_polylepis.1